MQNLKSFWVLPSRGACVPRRDIRLNNLCRSSLSWILPLSIFLLAHFPLSGLSVFFDLLNASYVSWKLHFIDTWALDLLRNSFSSLEPRSFPLCNYLKVLSPMSEMTIFFIAYTSTTYLWGKSVSVSDWWGMYSTVMGLWWWGGLWRWLRWTSTMS